MSNKNLLYLLLIFCCCLQQDNINKKSYQVEVRSWIFAWKKENDPDNRLNFDVLAQMSVRDLASYCTDEVALNAYLFTKRDGGDVIAQRLAGDFHADICEMFGKI